MFTRYLGDTEGLDLAGVPDVWTSTEIDERTTAVDGGGGSRHPLIDDPLLELVILQSSSQFILTSTESW